MEKHTSKKLLAGILALSAGFVLASCDPISATPKNYENPIILNEGNDKVDLKDNLMGKIYDAVATDRNTKIVSQILEEVATNKYGTYHDIVDVLKGTKTKADYVKEHKEAFGEDDLSEHRFDEFYKDIAQRISEVFYNEITSGSYNDDEGKFDENKLFMAHYYDFYDITAPATNEHRFIDNTLTKENAYIPFDFGEDMKAEDSFLKGVYYDLEKPRGYIEEKVFPQILKDKLVEDYVFKNSYGALGRSYARKVSYLKVSYTEYDTPWKLLKNFAEINIKSNNDMDFEMVVKAIKGIESFNPTTGGIVGATSSTNALLKNVLGVEVQTEKDTDNVVNIANAIKFGESDVLVPAGNYYKETKIGELLVSWKKAMNAKNAGRFATDEDKVELDKFTSSGKSEVYGLREKLVALAKEDYTTDGWFVKNGGLSELPSDLRDRLFNINVANSFDDDAKLVLEDGTEGHEYGAYEKDADGKPVKRLPYMRNVNGKKLVIPANSKSYNDNEYNYIYNDTGAKAFYIVMVEEAPSTAKLDIEADTVYSKVDKEDIARKVAKVLGTKDSYIKDAYTEYLSTYTWEFYETSLYEHFKSEYPDLFDDED